MLIERLTYGIFIAKLEVNFIGVNMTPTGEAELLKTLSQISVQLMRIATSLQLLASKK